MAAKFEIRSPEPGQYTWVLLSSGRILATSEPFSRKDLAEEAIVSFRMVAVNAPVLDMTVAPVSPTVAGVARATGRAVARAVVKAGRAVEEAQNTALAAAKTKKGKGKKKSKKKAGKKKKKR